MSIEELAADPHLGAEVTELPQDGPIGCPAEGCDGVVVEHDRGLRSNSIEMQGGYAFAAVGEGNWESDDPRFVCSETGWTVQMPAGFEIEDWS